MSLKLSDLSLPTREYPKTKYTYQAPDASLVTVTGNKNYGWDLTYSIPGKGVLKNTRIQMASIGLWKAHKTYRLYRGFHRRRKDAIDYAEAHIGKVKYLSKIKI